MDDNRLTSEEAALVAQRAPKVYIRAGSDIPKYDERGMTIIYVFGELHHEIMNSIAAADCWHVVLISNCYEMVIRLLIQLFFC